MILLLGGLFLVSEGILSIVLSQDQRSLSQVGRGLRIGFGTLLVAGALAARRIEAPARLRLPALPAEVRRVSGRR